MFTCPTLLNEKIKNLKLQQLFFFNTKKFLIRFDIVLEMVR